MLLVRVLVNRRLIVANYLGSQNINGFSPVLRVSVPNTYTVQGSTITISGL